MAKSKLLPGEELGFDLPPYSSLLGSESHRQEHDPVPPAPMQIPMPDGTKVYNPPSSVIMNNRKPISQPGSNSTNDSAIYDPMASIPPPPTPPSPSVDEEAAANQTVIISSQSGDDGRRSKRCRYMKICSAIGAVLVVLASMGRSLKYRQITRDKRSIESDNGMEQHLLYAQKEEIPKFVDPYSDQHVPKLQDYDGHQQMARDKNFENFKAYDLSDSKDEPVFKKLFKFEKSNRKRRDLRNTKNDFVRKKK